MSALEERDTTSPTPYERVQAEEEFQELRRRHRSFVFPMTVVFLAWYFLYVLLSTYATGFMSRDVFGEINVGLLMGLGQFVSTFLITWLYVRFANRRLDGLAEDLRERIEGGQA